MGIYVRRAHIPVKAKCTWGTIFREWLSVHHAYMAKKSKAPAREPAMVYRKTFVREWREHRGMTLEQLAERAGTTHATLSRLERGKQPYGQALLEAIAKVLGTDVPSLIRGGPADAEEIRAIMDAEPDERAMIAELAKAATKRRR